RRDGELDSELKKWIKLLIDHGRVDFLGPIIREPYFYDLTITLLEIALQRKLVNVTNWLLSEIKNPTEKSLRNALCIYVRTWNPSVPALSSFVKRSPFLSRIHPEAVFSDHGIMKICIQNNRCDIVLLL